MAPWTIAMIPLVAHFFLFSPFLSFPAKTPTQLTFSVEGRNEKNIISTTFKPTCLAAFSGRSAGSTAHPHHAFLRYLRRRPTHRLGIRSVNPSPPCSFTIHVRIRIRIRTRALVSSQVPAALSSSQLARQPLLVRRRLVSHPLRSTAH